MAASAQVATDIRRALDTQVMVSAHTLNASLATAAEPQVPPRATLGIALLATYAPCTTEASCIRIVLAVSLGLRLTGILGAEAGFTLADTEAPGETQHLFWFTSAVAGLSVRLGKDRRAKGSAPASSSCVRPTHPSSTRSGWAATPALRSTISGSDHDGYSPPLHPCPRASSLSAICTFTGP